MEFLKNKENTKKMLYEKCRTKCIYNLSIYKYVQWNTLKRNAPNITLYGVIIEGNCFFDIPFALLYFLNFYDKHVLQW